MARAVLLLVLSALAAPAGARAPPPGLEEACQAALQPRLGTAAIDPVLSRAAHALAARPSAEPVTSAQLRQALDEAGAFDPTATVLSVSAAAGDLPAAVARAFREPEITHVGLGAADRGGVARAVLLLAQRQITLEPFPRSLEPESRAVLRGALLPPLRGPQVFTTGPAGRPRAVAARGDGAFEASLAFDRAGRWLVEVLASGPRGPQVVALLAVSVGGAPVAAPPPARGPRAEPADVAESEAQVLDAVNRLRARHGLLPLVPRLALRDAARRHSGAMLAQGQVAHLLPGGADAGGRLRAARIPFRRVLENLARDATALAAHASLEESPAHLANLLSPDVEQVGIGVARHLSGAEPVVYLTELFVQPVDDSSESRLRPEARVREVLWQERKKRGQPPLLADPMLDELAARAARAMLQADDPGLQGFDAEALGLRRKIAAVDSFVASSPELAARSKNVGDARLRRVGIGVAIGDSPRYGAGLLWIAAVYTD
ncbi:MAG: CAP domain-containing protein [Deltaproteobacteria bacterium]|nr:CAP domain-containing protein [Deltaproteobacteria bacterium]